jgi:mono/diheme cytochrome c family protein
MSRGVRREHENMLKKIVVLPIVAALLIASALFAQADRARTIWEGVYTDAQAQRGKTAYETSCIACHKEDLTGIEDALKGERFFDKRREDTLDSFFTVVKTMPLRNPDSLGNQTYLDIISYVLQSNAFPSGTTELKMDALAQTRVVSKNGPAPLPASSTVSAVGCIQAGPNETWILVNATEPVRTRREFDRVEDELVAARAATLGTQTFRLQNAEYLDTKPKPGQKAQAKGTLVRAPAGNRIIVTFLEAVASSCP